MVIPGPVGMLAINELAGGVAVRGSSAMICIFALAHRRHDQVLAHVEGGMALTAHHARRRVRQVISGAQRLPVMHHLVVVTFTQPASH